MAGQVNHVELRRLAQITTYNSKCLFNHHYVSNEVFNKSAAVEEASSKNKASVEITAHYHYQCGYIWR